jgi:hypothetical protein
MAKDKKIKEPLNTSTKILILLGITTLIFIIAMIIIFCMYQMVPDVLIERYFTCVVGEGGFLMIIKVVKTVVEKKKDNLEDIEKLINDNESQGDEVVYEEYTESEDI